MMKTRKSILGKGYIYTKIKSGANYKERGKKCKFCNWPAGHIQVFGL